ncbi:hypothetical protein D9757_012686 [Collybiopsis confluens]|uniref:ASST-domain-containing protein n=1 Tax=Collybiopsis confluens TaxID=2823264 RepID=A0A8H5G5N4_9AGAR|nr:hypothetical protein D9757_012686 [Collybiopsis confluens]
MAIREFLLILALSPTRLNIVVKSDSIFYASTDYSIGAYSTGPYQTFFSSNATPVAFNFFQPMNKSAGSLDSGYLFTSPRGTSTKVPGAYIFDNDGHLIWDASSTYGETLVFQVETYKDEPLFLVWSGDLLGSGVGSGYINLHDEFDWNNGIDARITTNNTGLMTAYFTREANPSLTAYGGPESGYLFDSVLQELNITSGEPLFTWYASDHVDPGECYNSIGTGGGSTDEAWDFFHINSIEKTEDGNFLISSRHYYTLYYLDGITGEIIWRIGGANSSFSMGDGANFSWQHHARWITRNESYATMTLFDNAGEYGHYDETYSRGLYIGINFTDMSVSLLQDVTSPNRTVSESQGSFQLQPNGNFLSGWGYMPWYAEHSSTGDLLWSAQFGVIGESNNEAYRILRFNWTGTPTWSPSTSLIQSSSSSLITIHVSWNGDTQTTHWELLDSSSSSPSRSESVLVSLYNQSRTGFETTITFNTGNVNQGNGYEYYHAVRALSKDRNVLGISEYMKSTTNGALSAIRDGCAGRWSQIMGVLIVVGLMWGLQVV